ncbi:hypothetical protein QBC32DRAFT_384720 [Pseudoneurospora amorphoporcata]|uniref:WSC domain-containing protein n=1 Tax=Pseudoneurospora amorphoporcata TaxID=241081 RepID=A0AAN6SHB3_9PEZI|nr:hypothetical protein QBC32DRAFT_384720 [Pseudoneurospora amorphoporcata]
MGWQSSPGRLAVAAAGLLGLVNGQAYFGSFQTTLDKCGADKFVYEGCYANFESTAGAFFHFSPQGFTPLDPSRSFPGWDPGSLWDSTQTPLDCARTCRAFGCKYSAMRDNNCNCGLQLPAAAVPNADDSACNRQCSGDSTQFCGGGSDAQVYSDPSFSTAAEVPIVARNRDLAECFETCAGLGYPLVFSAREKVDDSTTKIRCQCGTNFNFGNYRVVPSTLANEGDCNADCAVESTGGDCDPKTQKCCGRNEHYPVYVNSELQGCYVPKTPGFKASAQQTTFNCYDPPSRLLGPPKQLNTGLPLSSEDQTNVITATANGRTALKRPLTIGTGPNTWYLHGCYGNPPAQVLSLPSQGGNPEVGQIITDLATGTLNECASRCRSNSTFNYFGMANGGECYCSTSLNVEATLDQMQTCRLPCAGDNTRACGGTNAPVVYSLVPSGVYTQRQALFGDGFPICSCLPRSGAQIEDAPIECPDDDGTSILTSQNKTFIVKCGAEYAGGGGLDLPSSTPYVNSYAECAEVCSATADCAAFIYQHGPPESNGQGAACYLKSDTDNGGGTTPGNGTDNGGGGTTPGHGTDNGGGGTTPGNGTDNGGGGTTPGNGTDNGGGTTPATPPATGIDAIADKVFGQAFQDVFSSFDKVFDINIGDLFTNIPFFKPKSGGSTRRAIATSNDEIQDLETLASDSSDGMASPDEASPASAVIGSNPFLGDMLGNLDLDGLLGSVPALASIFPGLDITSLISGNIRAADPTTPPKAVNLDELAGLANTVLTALNTLPSDIAVPGPVDTDSLITLAGAITDALTTAADGTGPGVINGKDFASILNSVFDTINGIGSIFPKKSTSSSAQPRMTAAPTRRLRARDVAHIGPHPTGVLPPGSGPAEVCDIATLALPANIFAPTPPPDAGRCIPIIGYWYVGETTLLPCSEGYGAGGPQETGSPQAPGFPGGPGGRPPHPGPPGPPPPVVIPVAGSLVLTQEQLNHLLESTNIELEWTSEGERVLSIPGVLDMSDSHSDTFRLLLDHSSDSLSHSTDQFEIPITDEVGLTQAQLDSLLQDSTFDIFWNSQGAKQLSIPGVIDYSSTRNDTFSLRLSSSHHHTTYSAGVPGPTETPTPSPDGEEPAGSPEEDTGYDDIDAELAALDALIASLGDINLDVGDLDIASIDVGGLGFPEVPSIDTEDLEVNVGDVDVPTVEGPEAPQVPGIDAIPTINNAPGSVDNGSEGGGSSAKTGILPIDVPDEEGAIPVVDPSDEATWGINGA